MNYILKAFILLVFFLSNGKLLPAQQQSIDSMQILLMRDSLQLSDSVILQVHTLRTAYLHQVAEVRRDSALMGEELTMALSLIVQNTNEGIKSLLGAEKFEKYIKMIRSRMKVRNPAGHVLASGVD